MYIIKVGRVVEPVYDVVSENGTPIAFLTDEKAKSWAKENIEGKATWVKNWVVYPIAYLNNT